ncbi:hypothetical protein INR49_019454 [Caranx melampygus]|nr:hypothetical protein INR49_019454 [Caranx melampygus]
MNTNVNIPLRTAHAQPQPLFSPTPASHHQLQGRGSHLLLAPQVRHVGAVLPSGSYRDSPALQRVLVLPLCESPERFVCVSDCHGAASCGLWPLLLW